jgi:hypothetical protein
VVVGTMRKYDGDTTLTIDVRGRREVGATFIDGRRQHSGLARRFV